MRRHPERFLACQNQVSAATLRHPQPSRVPGATALSVALLDDGDLLADLREGDLDGSAFGERPVERRVEGRDGRVATLPGRLPRLLTPGKRLPAIAGRALGGMQRLGDERVRGRLIRYEVFPFEAVRAPLQAALAAVDLE